MLAQVVVVLRPVACPVLAGPVEEVALDRRHPDPVPGRRCAHEALHVVAVVVGDEDVGDAVDPELVEPVEDAAAAEVDADRVAPTGITQTLQVS